MHNIEVQMKRVIIFFYLFMRVQIKVAAMVLPVILVFCITAIISAYVFHDHHHRKVFVGSVGLVASVAMYGSPLVVMVSHLFSVNIRIFFKQPNYTNFLQ